MPTFADFGSNLTQTQDGSVPPRGSSLISAFGEMPTGAATMGWNAFRGSRTILKGGFDETGFLHRKPRVLGLFGSNWSRSVSGSNPLGPRSWTRYANQNMLYDDHRSPLNMAAPLGNWLANKAMAGASRFGGDSNWATRLAAKMGDVDKSILDTEGGKGKQEFFSRGFVSRLSTSAKVGRRAELTGKRLRSVNSFLKIGGLDTEGVEGLTGKDFAHLIGMSNKGTISQSVAGYLDTARFGPTSDTVKGMAEKAGGREAYLSGSNKAVSQMAKLGIEKAEGFGFKAVGAEAAEKFGVEEGGKIALGKLLTEGGIEGAGLVGGEALAAVIPGVNVALAAMMVYDFTKMGMSMMKGGVQTMIDAGKSMKGSIEKGPMGMGYRDTTVASTSRQRGVMAIQASRLNARSVLGSEAMYMASHFG